MPDTVSGVGATVQCPYEINDTVNTDTSLTRAVSSVPATYIEMCTKLPLKSTTLIRTLGPAPNSLRREVSLYCYPLAGLNGIAAARKSHDTTHNFLHLHLSDRATSSPVELIVRPLAAEVVSERGGSVKESIEMLQEGVSSKGTQGQSLYKSHINVTTSLYPAIKTVFTAEVQQPLSRSVTHSMCYTDQVPAANLYALHPPPLMSGILILRSCWSKIGRPISATF